MFELVCNLLIKYLLLFMFTNEQGKHNRNAKFALSDKILGHSIRIVSNRFLERKY